MATKEAYRLLPISPMSGGQQIILRLSDNAHIPDDPDNMDYQEYLRWLDEGNTPEAPEVQIDPQIEE
jgi:hypothetical protein